MRYRKLLVIVMLIAGIAASFPLWHLKEMRAAQGRYDLTALAQEIAWFEKNAAWLSGLSPVRDSLLWSKLHQGKYAEVEALIANSTENKYRFWLFQIRLAEGQDSEAQSIAKSLNNESSRLLAEGLLAYKQSDFPQALEKFKAAGEKSLNTEERLLRLTALIRLEMAQAHWEQAGSYLQQAKALSVTYPLVLLTEFDYLLAREEWEQAKQLTSAIEKLPGYAQRPEYLVKSALLALIENKSANWNQILEQLSKQEKGKPYREYLLGVEAYQKNRLSEAVTRLKKSLELDLPQPFRQDAQSALNQASERLAAQPKLDLIKKMP